MVDCERRNPLSRSGTNQDARTLRALDPSFARIDERSDADLIVFAQRFSAQLQYYNDNNLKDGDWQPFFGNDVSAILARLGSLPVTSFRSFLADLQEYLTLKPLPPAANLKSHFKLLFHLPLLLLKQAGEGFARLPRDHPLRGFLQTMVVRDVDEPLRALIAFYKGALPPPPADNASILSDTKPDLIDYNTVFDDLDPRIQLPTTVSELLAGAKALSAFDIDADLISGIAPAGWASLYASVPPDPNPYLDSAGALGDQIFDALHYNLLSDAIERLFQAATRMGVEAQGKLEASLATDSSHAPHYGLWLAFVRLFAFSRDHLNGMTRRHLDYYYKDFLQLCLLKPQPAKVHLLLELGKTVTEHLLRAGTLFRAGKDAAGREIAYRLESDFVVNRAQVASLRSLLVPRADTMGVAHRLPYAASVTNSRDGQGAQLPKDKPRWKPFGPASGLPNARIGFAIADRQLFMRDGRRMIVLLATVKTPLGPARQLLGFKARFTTEKGWHELGGPPQLLACMQGSLIVFLIQLTGDDPPVVAYDPKVHGEEFGVTEPVLKIEFAFDRSPSQNAQIFPSLRDVELSSISLQVNAQGISNFVLQGDAGPLDPAKPFLPLGAIPEAGASFVLGSNEIFSKRLDQISLFLEWEKRLTETGFFLKKTPSSFKAKAQALNGGNWLQLQDTALFSDSSAQRTIVLNNLPDLGESVPQSTKSAPYSTASSSGFVRLVLQTGFGHARYQTQKTLALVQIARGDTWTAPTDVNKGSGLPRDPYTPKLIDFSVSYQTKAATPTHFFHLFPFGQTPAATNGALFPRLAHEGELYLGIRDLAPPQRLSLLFEVADGTANPLKGLTTLQWDYLRGNTWVSLSEQSVDDKTNSLSGSGVVGIAVPEDAGTTHTLLPAGLHWLRVSVDRDADALNDLVLVAAQAAAATFVDQGNDPNLLAAPLPAETISKLKVSDAAIKKVAQPYPSFGGKPSEDSAHFYIRASERLRHKDRGVTMWDYEHLVLQAFPGVYLVKCINHTELQRDPAQVIVADNELKPGHVLVVTVPYIGADSATDPLRPYTDKQTLVAIDRFLRKRLSPFVQLEVQNPKIEDIRVRFRVAFREDVKDIAFYKLELNSAVVRFLTPWAHPGGADISFGGKWHKSAIINFIEEQPYVDYITNVEMFHRADISQPARRSLDLEVAQATTARSILVSHPAHIIQAIV